MGRPTEDRYRELLNSGELYDSGLAELTAYQHGRVERLRQYNATSETPEGLTARSAMLCGRSLAAAARASASRRRCRPTGALRTYTWATASTSTSGRRQGPSRAFLRAAA